MDSDLSVYLSSCVDISVVCRVLQAETESGEIITPDQFVKYGEDAVEVNRMVSYYKAIGSMSRRHLMKAYLGLIYLRHT